MTENTPKWDKSEEEHAKRMAERDKKRREELREGRNSKINAWDRHWLRDARLIWEDGDD